MLNNEEHKIIFLEPDEVTAFLEASKPSLLIKESLKEVERQFGEMNLLRGKVEMKLNLTTGKVYKK